MKRQSATVISPEILISHSIRQRLFQIAGLVALVEQFQVQVLSRIIIIQRKKMFWRAEKMQQQVQRNHLIL